jgi:electron transfer flavoprotein beta subunit
MYGVTTVSMDTYTRKEVEFTAESEMSTIRFSMNLPGILSLCKDAKYKMPYIKYEDLDKDVDDKIKILNLEDLNLQKDEVGLSGSLTKVKRTFVKEYRKRDQEIIRTDENGIEEIFGFLKKHGYLGGIARDE